MRKNLRRVHGTSARVLSDLGRSLLEEIQIKDEGQDPGERQNIPTMSSLVAGARSKPR